MCKVNCINQRISTSRDFSRVQKKILKNMSEVKQQAKLNDIYFHFAPSKKGSDFVNMTVYKKGYDHITDIP